MIRISDTRTSEGPTERSFGKSAARAKGATQKTDKTRTRNPICRMDRFMVFIKLIISTRHVVYRSPLRLTTIVFSSNAFRRKPLDVNRYGHPETNDEKRGFRLSGVEVPRRAARQSLPKSQRWRRLCHCRSSASHRLPGSRDRSRGCRPAACGSSVRLWR